MSRLPNFAEPSTYLRYTGPVLTYPNKVSVQQDDPDTRLRFIRLNAREAPLKSHRVFSNVAPGVQSSGITFGDFEMLPSHILQVFMGVSYGGRVRVFHPQDQRVLKWDKQNLDIQEKDTGNLEYEDSPTTSPGYEFWVAPTQNFVPQFDAENVLSDVLPRRNIDIHVFFLAAKYTYEFVTPKTEPDIHDKLLKFQIPSRYVTFGGKI